MLSEEPVRRKVLVEEWVKLGWLGLLVFVVAVYWILYPSLLFDMVRLAEDAISLEAVTLSVTVVNFGVLLTLLSAIRFLTLMAINAYQKKTPRAIGNFVYATICVVLGILLSFWYNVLISTFELVNRLLLLVGLYIFSKGVTEGLFLGNRLSVSAGDWKDVIQGIKVFIFCLFLTEGNFAVFVNFTVFLAEQFNVSLVTSDLLVSCLAFLWIYLFVYILTELPSRLVFTKCGGCGMVFLNVSVHDSSWDSEHTLRHRHCPRCEKIC